MKIRFAVNTIIPVLILLFGLLVLALQYGVASRFDNHSMREAASNHLRLINSQILQLVNQSDDSSNPDKLSNDLRSLKGIQSDLEFAVVLDDSGTIVASTDPQWIDRSLSELPQLKQIASQLSAGDSNEGILSELDQNDRTHGVFMYELPGSERSGEQSVAGLVGVILNQHHVMQVRQEKRLTVAAYGGLMFALMTVLLWFFLSRFLVHPLQKLIAIVRTFAKGDFSTSANRTQDNEMGEISLLLDSLATINKQREKAEASRNRLAQIVEESVSEIYIVDADNYRIINANLAARKNLGYSLEECQTLMPWEFVQALSAQDMNQVTESLRNGDVAFLDFETVQQRKDGSTYPVHAVVQFMATQMPPVFTAIAQDITERKRQEQDVRLRDRAIEELDVGVSILDATKIDRPFVYVNRRLCEMSGFSARQLLGRGPDVLRDANLNFDVLRQMNESIGKGDSAQGILDFRRQDGTSYIVDVSLSPVHGAEGYLTHFIAIVRDITEKLETEALMNRSRKIEAIGQLAGGVAHDFNNLLGVIIGNIEFLKLSVVDENNRQLLNQADMAAQMGARLTRKLLSFAKQDKLDPVVLDANEQVKEAMNLLRTTIGENYALSFSLAKDLWGICADPSGIENAVINLALNARDAMPDGGQILIDTSNISLIEGDTIDSLGVVPGDYVKLSVSDTGSGMTQATKERIFEPFFTTKEVGENTGLGLASTYGFAQQSGGNVLVDSIAGAGSVISLLLPRHDSKKEIPEPMADWGVELSAGDCRVLVVEDNEMVRDVTIQRLHGLGYLTRQAGNGPEAIEIFEQGECIDLVLTDLVMDGGMSGYEVASWVSRHHPDCKIMLTSGYSEKCAKESQTDIGNFPLLQKPYKIAVLQEAINDVMLGE